MAGCSRVGTPVVEVDPELVVVDPVVVVDWVEAVVEVVVDAVVDVVVDAVGEVEAPPVVEVEADVVVAESSVVSLPHPASIAAANETATITRVIFMSIPPQEGPAGSWAGITVDSAGWADGPKETNDLFRPPRD